MYDMVIMTLLGILLSVMKCGVKCTVKCRKKEQVAHRKCVCRTGVNNFYTIQLIRRTHMKNHSSEIKQSKRSIFFKKKRKFYASL